MHLLTIIANLCGLQKLGDDYADAFGDVPALPEMARQQRAIGGTNSLTTDAHDRTNKVIARPHNRCVTP